MCAQIIRAGINDLGGISPLTMDYINPESAWPKIRDLKRVVGNAGLTLKERLSVYPEFIKRGQYPYSLGELIEKYAGDDGLVRQR